MCVCVDKHSSAAGAKHSLTQHRHTCIIMMLANYIAGYIYDNGARPMHSSHIISGSLEFFSGMFLYMVCVPSSVLLCRTIVLPHHTSEFRSREYSCLFCILDSGHESFSYRDVNVGIAFLPFIIMWSYNIKTAIALVTELVGYRRRAQLCVCYYFGRGYPEFRLPALNYGQFDKSSRDDTKLAANNIFVSQHLLLLVDG